MGRWSTAAARWGCLVLVVLAAAGFLVGPSGRVDAPLDMLLALAAGFLPVGLFLTRAQPGHAVARLVLATGMLAAGAVTAVAWSGAVVPAWVAQWAWWPAAALVPLALLFFPDGALPSQRWRPLAVVLAACAGTGTLALAVAAAQHPRSLLTSGESGSPLAHVLVRGVIAVALVLIVSSLLVVASLLRRARGAESLLRRQLACMLPAGVLFAAGVVLDATGVSGALVPGVVALPLGIGIAVLRFRLGDLDLVVNRTLVWLVMTLLVLGVYAVGIGLAGSRLRSGGATVVASALATGLVAAGFDPARRAVQRAVDRLLFGDRDTPHLVLQRLGRRMQEAGDPGTMLDQLVVTLVDALRVPYARMVVDTSDGSYVTAAHGRPQPELTTFALLAHGERVGSLEVAPRRAGEVFTPAERTLLRDVASQAGIAAQAHRLTLALQRSREALVLAREEERLRIRRDLHDGLGPALVGTRMQVRAAQAGATTAGAADVVAMLDAAVTDLTGCAGEIRRVVDGLRPPALDQGLPTALRQQAGTVLTGLPHEVVVDGDLAGLPAAVEVALYRIAAEALSNVARHAGAGRCDVLLRHCDDDVLLRVADDGRGGPLARDGGVGLESMRLRATELGGRLEVTPGSGGTTVTAVIPLHRLG
ncbi:sensor histidine kinase [Jiangella endophytica]|uniref:sensor histidine kinase n=1 Tax=Jiangella endophytica TaxID=1623398 RepID=UPI000E357360|nr:GAF domain-containing sensor histidine kinase [Jiangella endophytica]